MTKRCDAVSLARAMPTLLTIRHLQIIAHVRNLHAMRILLLTDYTFTRCAGQGAAQEVVRGGHRTPRLPHRRTWTL